MTTGQQPASFPIRPDLEITPADARAMLARGTLLLIDVRTREEHEFVNIPGGVLIPVDQIEKRADEVEPREGQVVATLCHHGVRSMRAALALRALGHPKAVSVAGGIEAWARHADPSVRRYERSGGVITPVR
jgi:adenylyltransferase/sulfurtransferase